MLCWLVCSAVWNLPSGPNVRLLASASRLSYQHVNITWLISTRPAKDHNRVSHTARFLHTMLSRTLAVRTPFVYLKAARSFSASAQVRHTKVTQRPCYTPHIHTTPHHSSLQRHAKVAVLGAAGGIGQPMSLLLKQSPLISQLALYDIVGTPGVAADLSHIETVPQV